MGRRVISGRSDLQDAYRDERVAREYVERRFETPLGSRLHRSQVGVLRQLLAAESLARVAEIAPGPARVTVDVAPLVDRIAIVDASLQMLGEARRRLTERRLEGRVSLVQADAFRLPFRPGFDLVYSFRLIRHFERAERVQLYRQVFEILRPGGYFVFDAVNKVVSETLRAEAPGEYEHFDALLTADEVAGELREAGFADVSLHGVQYRYRAQLKCQVYVAPRSAALARWAMAILDRLGGEPLEWVVRCRRG